MNMIKWRYNPSGYSSFPVQVEVIKETACTVTIRAKSSRSENYHEYRINKLGVIFDTFEAAKEAAIKFEKNRLISAEAEVQRAKDRLQKVNNWKHPK